MSENKKKAILSDYLFNKASARKILLSCAFEISPLCNMDCKMCYIRMTKEELDKRGRLRSIYHNGKQSADNTKTASGPYGSD